MQTKVRHGRKPNRQRLAIVREFQTPAMSLEDEEPPKATKWTLYALTAFLFLSIIWSSLAEIDEIVVTRGELVSTTPTLVVQPLELAVIRTIDVRAGDIVTRGQKLASLDPTFAQADVDQLRTRLNSLMARQARLEAELARQDYFASGSPSEPELLEASLFEERKSNFANRVRGFSQDLARIKATIATAQSNIEATSASVALLQEIVDMRQTLSDQALASRISLLEARSQLLSARRDLSQNQGMIEQLTHEAENTNAQLDAFVQAWREEAADELTTVTRDRETIQEDLNKALRRRNMTSLTAPEDAVVLEVAKRSTGSVLQGAETLFTLVPLDAPLELEVRISPNDIGFIQVGDDVRVKLDAFPFQKYGTLRGRIETISADTFTPNQGGQDGNPASGPVATFYKARVSLTETYLRKAPANYRLLPGMTVTADIDVGTRTVISYMLYPVLGAIDTSVREP